MHEEKALISGNKRQQASNKLREQRRRRNLKKLELELISLCVP